MKADEAKKESARRSCRNNENIIRGKGDLFSRAVSHQEARMLSIIVCIGLVMLTAGASDLRAAEPTKMVIGYAALNARIAPLWAAKEFGFLAKNDIDGDVIFIRGAPTLTA